MVGKVIEGIAERFISKKLGAYLGTLGLGLYAAAQLDPQAREAFLKFAALIGGSYLGAQGIVDAVSKFAERKGRGGAGK